MIKAARGNQYFDWANDEYRRVVTSTPGMDAQAKRKLRRLLFSETHQRYDDNDKTLVREKALTDKLDRVAKHYEMSRRLRADRGLGDASGARALDMFVREKPGLWMSLTPKEQLEFKHRYIDTDNRGDLRFQTRTEKLTNSLTTPSGRALMRADTGNDYLYALKLGTGRVASGAMAGNPIVYVPQLASLGVGLAGYGTSKLGNKLGWDWMSDAGAKTAAFGFKLSDPVTRNLSFDVTPDNYKTSDWGVSANRILNRGQQITGELIPMAGGGAGIKPTFTWGFGVPTAIEGGSAAYRAFTEDDKAKELQDKADNHYLSTVRLSTPGYRSADPSGFSSDMNKTMETSSHILDNKVPGTEYTVRDVAVASMQDPAVLSELALDLNTVEGRATDTAIRNFKQAIDAYGEDIVKDPTTGKYVSASGNTPAGVINAILGPEVSQESKAEKKSGGEKGSNSPSTQDDWKRFYAFNYSDPVEWLKRGGGAALGGAAGGYFGGKVGGVLGAAGGWLVGSYADKLPDWWDKFIGATKK